MKRFLMAMLALVFVSSAVYAASAPAERNEAPRTTSTQVIYENYATAGDSEKLDSCDSFYYVMDLSDLNQGFEPRFRLHVKGATATALHKFIVYGFDKKSDVTNNSLGYLIKTFDSGYVRSCTGTVVDTIIPSSKAICRYLKLIHYGYGTGTGPIYVRWRISVLRPGVN